VTKLVKYTLTMEVPYWVRYTAIDSDGKIFGYSHKPLRKSHEWWPPSVYNYSIHLGQILYFPSGWDWENTLREVK
jgi:hypothetical protein